MKQKITVNEVLLRVLIFALVIMVAISTDTEDKQWLNALGFTVALLGTFYLRKHFFPFMTAAIACYLIASVTELWNEDYKYLPITIQFWMAGSKICNS